MIVVAITGSIASGKSTVASRFAARGAALFDADQAVREYYSGEGARAIAAAFPSSVIGGVVDRRRLGAMTLVDPEALRRLEAIVHPEAARRRFQFLRAAEANGARVAAVEIPLLFETGGDRQADVVVVATAAEDVRRARALNRQGMTEEKLRSILARQTPDEEKRRRAHLIVDTNKTISSTWAQVDGAMRALAGMVGRGAWHA